MLYRNRITVRRHQRTQQKSNVMKHSSYHLLTSCLLLVLGPIRCGIVSADEKEDAPFGRHDLIDNYESALDHLTREFLFLMEKKNLLVVWCFDQSESMKDDQAEIRARIKRVYEELALVHKDKGKLLSSVVSYGDRFFSEVAEVYRSFHCRTGRYYSDLGVISTARPSTQCLCSSV